MIGNALLIYPEVSVNRQQLLLTILAEECAEVAHRVSKAIRFGMLEIQPGEDLQNVRRLEMEMADLLAVWKMLERHGMVTPIAHFTYQGKFSKVEKTLDYSRELGILKDED